MTTTTDISTPEAAKAYLAAVTMVCPGCKGHGRYEFHNHRTGKGGSSPCPDCGGMEDRNINGTGVVPRWSEFRRKCLSPTHLYAPGETVRCYDCHGLGYLPDIPLDSLLAVAEREGYAGEWTMAIRDAGESDDFEIHWAFWPWDSEDYFGAKDPHVAFARAWLAREAADAAD